MKLLVVEDNEGMRRLIRGVVADLAEVYECSDGAEAVAAYAQYQPDWVLMDIKMRRTHGITATRQIIAAFPGARVVIVTNYDDAEIREAAREAGACEFILKDSLVEVRRVLGAPPPATPP